MKIGSTDINDIKIGSTTINKVYRNGVVVYEKSVIPYQSNLSLHYTSRSGLDLLETKSGLNLNAKILPSCGQITTSAYAMLNVLAFEGSDSSGYIECRFYFNDTTNTLILFSTSNNGNTAGYFISRISSKKPVLTFRNGITPAARALTGIDSLIAGWNIVRWDCDGSDFHLTVNGISKTFSDSGSGPVWLSGLNSPNSRDNVSIGASVLSTITISSETFKIDYVDYNNKHKWIVTGMGTRIFDIIGTNHLTWVGSDYLAYDVGASTYMLDNGFAIWTKSSQMDEYVPYKSGSPMDVSLGLIGYEKRANYVGGAAFYNYAPSLVDFDYLDTTNVLLTPFDKSNTTHHIATASMNYYDVTNKYRWRQDELADPRVYSQTYKKVGYRGIVTIKGDVVSGLIKNFSESVVYLVDKTGGSQWNVAQYCTIQSIVTQSMGLPVYNVDNYLTYNSLPTDLTALSLAFVGDSTMGSHSSGSAIAVLFNTYTNFSTHTIATTGDTINQQKDKWDLILAEDKLLYDYVLVQIGLNDLANDVPTFCGYYQLLIDKIRADVKVSCKIIASTMIPCGEFFIPAVMVKWTAANVAITGIGANAITGIDFINTLNTSLLNDGSDNLAVAYDSGDHLHPNQDGRIVIYNNYLPYIVR